MNEGWLAVCHRQTTWAGPVVHSQSVWQSCDGGMRDDSGCSSQLHHKVRYAFVRQARHRTARTHARFVGSSRNRHRHSENEGTSHNVSSYLKYTNILMISMPEGEVNSQRPLFFTPSTILVQLRLGVVHSLLGQYINVLQYNTRVSVLY